MYIALITDENQIPPILRDLVSVRLAAEICYTITGDASLIMGVVCKKGERRQTCRWARGNAKKS
jgi:hypothetical protein